jgi:hypothetical protein
MTYYNQEIVEQKNLANGLIKITVLSDTGALVVYHVIQEELDNAN